MIGYQTKTAEFACVCALCEELISKKETFYDGGLGRRAHVHCVERYAI
jgi:hypothetical protein